MVEIGLIDQQDRNVLRGEALNGDTHLSKTGLEMRSANRRHLAFRQHIVCCLSSTGSHSRMPS